MNWLDVLTFAAAAIGPLSHIPMVYRMVTRRTSDGMSLTLCGLTIVSYGTWLVLASGVGAGMYVLLVTSSAFGLFEMLYVRHIEQRPWWEVAGWCALGAVSTVLAVGWPWLALGYVVVLDLSWYWRAVNDIRRSVAAHAVSVWSVLMWIASDLAWVTEAIRYRQWILALQCGVLTAASLVVLVATVTAHRRAKDVVAAN